MAVRIRFLWLLGISALPASSGCGPQDGADSASNQGIEVERDSGLGASGSGGVADSGPGFIPTPDAELPPDSTPPDSEVCGNGLDDDGDGQVDEGCACSGGSQPCYPGNPGDVGRGICSYGAQECDGNGEFGSWGPCTGAVLPTEEVCGDSVDQDCDGAADDGCPTTVSVDLDIDGDCVEAACPGTAPFPVGCNVTFDGGDQRGCVANVPGKSAVFFKEGNQCGAGHLSGVLYCSSDQGQPLDATNCPINKPVKLYVTDPQSCP